ncbi:MAG: ATP-dependent Clp protease adaptor ClpS [Bacteroidota bacterium]|nr:ATP-dependent Clp protease adaptor ClpS [Bacteroidota bacterium]
MKEKTLHSDDRLSNESVKYTLILYNDEINTFDHVIKSLMEVCGHDPVQAEQCALIVHLKGSCDIKSGNRNVLLPMSKSLNAKGLTSKVKSL